MSQHNTDRSRILASIAAGVCLSALLAAGVYELFQVPSATRRSHKELLENDDLREQIRTIEGHVRLLRAHQKENEERRPDLTEDDSESWGISSEKGRAESDALPREESPEKAKARTAARYEFLDKSFQSEARDLSWSRDVEHEILGVFQDEAFANVELQSASCASTMCKVRLLLTDQTEFQEFQMKAAQALQPFLPRGTMREEEGHDGSLEVTAYLAPPEHRLPHWKSEE